MRDVVIVGGGPVGAFLALRLHALGVAPLVLERRERARAGARSIGIHPPSLERLDALGLGGALTPRGVAVRRGRLFVHTAQIADLDLSATGGRFPYVLSVPQPVTEQVLREALAARGAPVVFGAHVRSLRPRRDHVELEVQRDGRSSSLSARYVVACDGRRSHLRRALGVAFRGETHPGSYAMVDAPDPTALGDDACIFLHREGLTESFPLAVPPSTRHAVRAPPRRRRWVIRRQGGPGELASPSQLVESVARRTGHRLPVASVPTPNVFVAEERRAARFVLGRVAFAGDAAHVVSPIGGQGMNLGWLGAWSLGAALVRALDGDPEALALDGAARRELAERVGRRARLNMWLGRPGAGLGRALLLRVLLGDLAARRTSRLFTMGGLVEPPHVSTAEAS